MATLRPKTLTSDERSMLYYFLDAVGGAPDEYSSLLQIAKRGERTEAYHQALDYMARLIGSIPLTNDVREFRQKLASAILEPQFQPHNLAESEAQEAIRRSMR